MNEDTKNARKFEIFYSGLAGTFSVRNNYDAYLMNIQRKKDDEYIKLIELTPVLEMMESMAEAFERLKYLADTNHMISTTENYEVEIWVNDDDVQMNCDDILESYQAFKRDNGLEAEK